MNQKGFSLLELILASFISCLLIIITGEWLVNCIQQTRLESALIELEQNAQFAEHILKQEIMTAGFIGCRNLMEAPTIDYSENKQIEPLTPDNALSIDSNLSPRLCIRKVDSLLSPIISRLSPTEIVLPDTEQYINSGDQVLITNCEQSGIFVIQRVEVHHNQQESLVIAHLPTLLPSSSWIGKLKQDCFFLQKSRVSNSYSLYQQTTSHQKLDLLPGVADWQIECFIDNQWVLASEVTRWSKVLALRIHLLLRSEKSVFKTPSSYMFLEKQNKSMDNNLYREFVFFIPLIERGS